MGACLEAGPGQQLCSRSDDAPALVRQALRSCTAANITWIYWTSGRTTRPTPSTRRAAQRSALQPAAHACGAWGTGTHPRLGRTAALAARCLPAAFLLPAAAPRPAAASRAEPAPPSASAQMPKTYSFLVKYSFLWRAAFNMSQVRRRAGAALQAAPPATATSWDPTLGLPAHRARPTPPRWMPARIRKHLPPPRWLKFSAPLHEGSRSARFPSRCPQPRIVHVPCATASAAVVGRRVSEAFDIYQPDLVVSVHPLMQVQRSAACAWTRCAPVHGTPAAPLRWHEQQALDDRPSSWAPARCAPRPPLPQHVPLRIMRMRIKAGMQPPTNFATVVTDLTTCHNTWFHPGVDRWAAGAGRQGPCQARGAWAVQLASLC